VALRVLVDVARDPTSHNLWPLELGMIVAAGCGGRVRRRARRRRAAQDAEDALTPRGPGDAHHAHDRELPRDPPARTADPAAQ
jgi:hypothetical protein